MRLRFVLAIPILMLALSTANAGKIVLVAGGGTGGDGSPATQAKLTQPFGIDFGEDGTIYFVEMVGGERLRAIGPDGVVRTLAGTGKKGNAGDGGPGLAAEFNGLHSLVVGPRGQVYLADTFNNRIRVYDPSTGKVEAFAGTGERGFAGDGANAVGAKFGNTYCLAFDAKRENIYLADLDNKRIRKMDLKEKLVTTVAGNGVKGVPKDNTDALDAPLVDPRAVAVASDFRIYILERGGHALRMVSPGGKMVTLAGTGKPGFDLGGGNPLKTQLNGPKHLCIEPQREHHSVLIADSENHRILRYRLQPGGAVMELVAGTGKRGANLGDGDPLKAELAQPHGVAVHPKTGEIYIADSSNHRILKIAK